QSLGTGGLEALLRPSTQDRGGLPRDADAKRSFAAWRSQALLERGGEDHTARFRALFFVSSQGGGAHPPDQYFYKFAFVVKLKPDLNFSFPIPEVLFRHHSLDP